MSMLTPRATLELHWPNTFGTPKEVPPVKISPMGLQSFDPTQQDKRQRLHGLDGFWTPQC
uniref:GekBS144P n=1 Tax=Gekko japonicus TaxID=146911 RepID=Q5EI07_GEKJA|nr:GekBS144P [Gekko japonicus]